MIRSNRGQLCISLLPVLNAVGVHHRLLYCRSKPFESACNAGTPKLGMHPNTGKGNPLSLYYYTASTVCDAALLLQGTGFGAHPGTGEAPLQTFAHCRNKTRSEDCFYRDTKTGDAPRHWRWRGFITDYYTAEAAPQHAQASATDSSANSTTATQQPLTAAQDSNSNNQGAAQQADAVTAHSDSNSSDGVQHGGAERQPSDNAAEGRQPVSDAPAFLLVHGFGAFGEQWRGQIQALTAAGYQVICNQCLSADVHGSCDTLMW